MKSWTCIDKCGACCKFDLNERLDTVAKLSLKDIAEIKLMTNKDGWCKYLDQKNKKCKIYKNRPHFCRVEKFSMKFKEYYKKGDEFLINCCKENIRSIYGKDSWQMKNYKKEIIKN